MREAEHRGGGVAGAGDDELVGFEDLLIFEVDAPDLSVVREALGGRVAVDVLAEHFADPVDELLVAGGEADDFAGFEADLAKALHHAAKALLGLEELGEARGHLHLLGDAGVDARGEGLSEVFEHVEG
jgi:hypothetical protein